MLIRLSAKMPSPTHGFIPSMPRYKPPQSVASFQHADTAFVSSSQRLGFLNQRLFSIVLRSPLRGCCSAPPRALHAFPRLPVRGFAHNSRHGRHCGYFMVHRRVYALNEINNPPMISFGHVRMKSWANLGHKRRLGACGWRRWVHREVHEHHRDRRKEGGHGRREK